MRISKVVVAVALVSVVLGALVLGAAKAEEELARFEIVIEPTASGATLSCNQGCAWTELSFVCGEVEPCSVSVDEYGMVEE